MIVPWPHEMLSLDEAGGGVYGISLYYLCHCSMSPEVFQNKKFKRNNKTMSINCNVETVEHYSAIKWGKIMICALWLNILRIIPGERSHIHIHKKTMWDSRKSKYSDWKEADGVSENIEMGKRIGCKRIWRHSLFDWWKPSKPWLYW